MNGLRLTASGAALALVALVLATTERPSLAQNEPPNNTAVPGVDVQTHGPLHEAFGQPIVYDPAPGLVVAKQPPSAIQELPPDEKPEGDDVAWIPGYWGCDEVNQNFIWISGFWRHMPADRQWVPGYWAQVANGWQWVSGNWAAAAQQEVAYLPQPPASLEVGPSTQPPDENHIWAPGCWTWAETRYAWRPGYWLADQPGWTWTPDSYCWSPRGYVFVNGFWDLSPVRRGLLFAPAVFQPAVLAQAGFAYTPSLVLDINNVVNSFFCWPRYHHYCFGDYFAPSFLQAGIYPWFSYHQSRFGYDPVYAYYSHWYERRDPRWATWQRDEYVARRDNPRERPPLTFAGQQTLVQQLQRSNVPNGQNLVQHSLLARPLREFAASAGTGQVPMRLTRLDQKQRTEFVERAKDVTKFVRERQRLEATPRTDRPGGPAGVEQPIRHKVAVSPLVAHAPRDQERTHVAPAAPKVPRAQPEVKAPTQPVTRPHPEERLQLNRPGQVQPGAQPPKGEERRPTPAPKEAPSVKPLPVAPAQPPKSEERRPTPAPKEAPAVKPAPPAPKEQPRPVAPPREEPRPAVQPRPEERRVAPPAPAHPPEPRVRPNFQPRDEGQKPAPHAAPARQEPPRPAAQPPQPRPPAPKLPEKPKDEKEKGR